MRWILIAVLTAHFALSLYVSFTEGYFSVFPPFEQIWATQMFSDLAISLGLVFLCFLHDARRRKRPLRYVLLCGVGMIFLGSISPLVYAILDKELLA